jgi:hypothetical protein
MATPIGDGQAQGDQGDGSGGSGPNPAWNDVLNVIPSDLHEQVTPFFQQWDQSAQQRITEANSKVAAFEPYQPFVENGISYEDLEQGLQLAYQLNANPQGVYDALGQAYNFGQQQNGEGQGAGEGEGEGYQDPRYDELSSAQQQLQQGLDLVAQTVLQQNEQKMAAEADQQIDSELAQLKKSHPGISEEFALSLMVNGFGVDEVANHWQQVSQGILQQHPRPFAPNVLGGNGGGTGLPSQAINPAKLDGPARRNLVAQMVHQMNQQP